MITRSWTCCCSSNLNINDNKPGGVSKEKINFGTLFGSHWYFAKFRYFSKKFHNPTDINAHQFTKQNVLSLASLLTLPVCTLHFSIIQNVLWLLLWRVIFLSWIIIKRLISHPQDMMIWAGFLLTKCSNFSIYDSG